MLNHREPAEETHPKFFHDPAARDFLVQYDEINERTEAIQRRAYFLYPNLERVKQNQRPRFVSQDEAKGLHEVPIVPASSVSTNSTAAIVVTVSAKGDQFTIYAAGQKIGPHVLPVYADRSDKPQRILLTPFAVAGDGIMVGLVASIVACWGFCAGEVSFGI